MNRPSSTPTTDKAPTAKLAEKLKKLELENTRIKSQNTALRKLFNDLTAEDDEPTSSTTDKLARVRAQVDALPRYLETESWDNVTIPTACVRLDAVLKLLTDPASDSTTKKEPRAE